MVIEAFDLTIQKYNNPMHINELGAIQYRAKQYDLAEKYYLIAAEKYYLISISNLGYLYYYGRTGKIDYEKAFYWFNKASELGDIPARIKIADMHKNGYYAKRVMKSIKISLLICMNQFQMTTKTKIFHQKYYRDWVIFIEKKKR